MVRKLAKMRLMSATKLANYNKMCNFYKIFIHFITVLVNKKVRHVWNEGIESGIFGCHFSLHTRYSKYSILHSKKIRKDYVQLMGKQLRFGFLSRRRLRNILRNYYVIAFNCK